MSELDLLYLDLLDGSDALAIQIKAEAPARRFAELGETRDTARAWLLVAETGLSRQRPDLAHRALTKVREGLEAFADRQLQFDLAWVEAWASEPSERELRLHTLQQQARERGYLAQARRVEQVLGIDEPGTSNMHLPLPPYARATP